MTRPRARGGRFALLLLLLPVCFLPLVVSGQRTLAPVRSPKISDWSTRHVVFTQFATSNVLEAASRDPRAAMRWRELDQLETQRRLGQFRSRSYLQFGLRNPILRFPMRTPTSNIQRDWNINLGTTGTANSMYPAKSTFNPATTSTQSPRAVQFQPLPRFPWTERR